MSSFLKTYLACGAAALLSLAMAPAQANVMLTFKVNNVTLQTCSGLIQPTCSTAAAADFQETVVVGGLPLAPPTDSSSGAVRQSAAMFGFPLFMSGSPFTSSLLAMVSNPANSTQRYTALDNSFDGSVGTAAAGIFSDIVSDTKDLLGQRTQQEYKLGYNLLGQFSDPLSYTDLVSESIDAFFDKYVGSVGSFMESGASSTLDPLGLQFTDYAFSQYLGDITLIGVGPAAVPEPGSAALVLAAALALLCARRRRNARSNVPSLR